MNDKKEPAVVPELCRSCRKNPAEEDHACPFAEEIYNDHEPCNCCKECTNECCMDI